MNRNERLCAVVFTALFWTSLLFPILSANQNSSSTPLTESSSLVEGRLTIVRNSDWEFYGWPGNGTEISPYLVENMNLIEFQICASNKSFEIRNCVSENEAYIEATSNGKIEDSIYIESLRIYTSSNLTISNVTFDSFLYSDYYTPSYLEIRSSEKITVEDCIVTGSRNYGVRVENSNNCTIQRNAFSNCGRISYVTYIMAATIQSPNADSFSPAQSTDFTIHGGALYIDNCSICFISNNTLIDNVGFGIHCRDSADLELSRNFEENSGLTSDITCCRESKLLNNTFNSGLDLDSSILCTLVGNEFGRNGLFLAGNLSTLFHRVIDNSVHSKPLLVIANESDTIYANSEYGQMYIINSSRIHLKQLILGASLPSIYILYSSSCNITKTTCPSIRIDHSSNSEVFGNIVTEGFTGIRFENAIDCKIYNNSILDTVYGVHIGHGSNGSRIYDNNLIDVGRFGIWITSPFCVVENNTLTGCATTEYHYGHWQVPVHFGAIRVFSDDCVIHNNSVVDNHGYGIWITGNRNLIYKNTLIGNSKGNGLSEGANNQWDNGIDTGNYWGDWIGYGVYYVPGNEACVDSYPRGLPNSITPVNAIVFAAIGSVAIMIVLAIVRRRKSIISSE